MKTCKFLFDNYVLDGDKDNALDDAERSGIIGA